jgi:glutaminase
MSTGRLPNDGSTIPADVFPDDPNNFEFIIEPAVVNALKMYFSTCSIELTARDVAMAAATMANGGVCPTTQERVLEQTTVRSCLAVTQMCGMYDGSGDFFYSIGLPAKSGVGGGVLLIAPKLMGVCIFSPRLDAQGNSVRGVDFAKRIIKEYRLHAYDGVMTDKHRVDPRIPIAQWRASNSSEALWAASKGDIRTLERLHNEQFDLENGDYDKRTPMHLAAAEGHLEVIKFLIEHNNKPIRDRWGGYPIADAKENGHVEIVEIFEKLDLPQDSPVHLAEDPKGTTNSSTKFADDLSVIELLWAAAENDVLGLRRLVAKGVPVHAEDYDKRTALHLAASEGALDAAKYLVAHGHPLHVRDRWNATPLDEARRENRKELIYYLTNKISEQEAATDG